MRPRGRRWPSRLRRRRPCPIPDVGGEYHAPPRSCPIRPSRASPRPRRRARSRTRPGPGASPWPRRRAAGRAPPPAWPCRAAAPAARSAGTSRGRRRGRGDPEGGGHVGLAAPRLAVEDQVLRVAHKRPAESIFRWPCGSVSNKHNSKKGSLKSTGSLCLQANVCPKRGDLRSRATLAALRQLVHTFILRR